MRKKYYRSSQQYRQRAEECRTSAEILGTEELRDKMLTIAADYERLAEAVDELTRDDEPEVHAVR